MSRCISAIGLATPFVSVSSNVKPMPRTIASMKALAALAVSLRIIVPARVKQIRSDDRHLATIESNGATVVVPLTDVDHADDDGSLTGPFSRFGRVDRPAVCADPPQAGRPGIALTDRVRGDQPEAAILA